MYSIECLPKRSAAVMQDISNYTHTPMWREMEKWIRMIWKPL